MQHAEFGKTRLLLRKYFESSTQFFLAATSTRQSSTLPKRCLEDFSCPVVQSMDRVQRGVVRCLNKVFGKDMNDEI